MSRIKVLSSNLIDKIAAGEVVERPASVVKELVENSLDAGADFLEISIEDGGKKSITVRDNGMGMSTADAKLAVKRHATSKISSADDLNSLATYGFRGEALSSIAGVSKFRLQTSQQDTVEGTEIEVIGGETAEVHTCAHPPGTTVIVEDLFFNLPARRKFLKTARTEFGHVRKQVQAAALGAPQAGFLLQHNNRKVINVPKERTWRERLENLVDWNLEKFASLDLDSPYLSLQGLIGLPEVSRKNRPEQFLFVNNRFLQNRTISGALYNAYQEIVPKGIHPPYFLLLEVRKDLVDVNVHPRKEEIKFSSPSTVYDAVSNAVSEALNRSADSVSGLSVSQSLEESAEQSETNLSPNGRKSSSFQKRLSYSEFSESKRKAPSVRDWESFYEQVEKGEETENIWQIAQLYLVFPLENGLVVYDQHAAEERILFEQFLANYKNKRENADMQQMLFSEKITPNERDYSVLKENQKILEKVGFELEFNDGELNITAVPVRLQERDVGEILRNFADDLSNESQKIDIRDVGLDIQILRSLAYLACRSAVKQGDRLDIREREHIVRELDSLGSKGLTCPHGRPTKIKLSLDEFARRFHRK